jgi:hypothetical protein
MEGAKDNGAWGVRPDDGFEVAFTEDQYSDYRRYRNRRDMGELPPSVKLNAEDLPAPPADFADGQLAKAVEHLQKSLDKRAAKL